MTLRRLSALIRGLPPESLTMTALRNDMPEDAYEEQADQGEPEKDRWSKSEQLLAGITDSLRRLEYLFIVANSDSKSRKPKKPEPMRRPGVGSPEKRTPLSENSQQHLFRLLQGG